MRHYTDGPDSSAGEIIERPVGNVRERAVAIIDPLNDELHNMLPAGIKLERYKSAFLTAVLRDRDILTCDAPSIRLALLKCANDGLVPDGRQAALVRFGTTCTYMPMVAGILARAHELGDLLGVNAQCVHEKDVFRCNLADVNDTHHEAPPLGEHRGFVVGAYAIFRNPQGLVIHREIMTRSDLQRVRAIGKSRGKVWEQWFEEMCRKSVIRRGSKFVPVSEKLRDIINRDDEMTTVAEAERTPATPRNPLLPPPEEITEEADGLAPLIDRLREGLAQCTTAAEIEMIVGSLDAELLEAPQSEQDIARVMINKRAKELKAAGSAA